MIGYLPDGTEVELTRSQEYMVTRVLQWEEDGKSVSIPSMGRGAGKTIVMSTLAELNRRKHAREKPCSEGDQDSIGCNYDGPEMLDRNPVVIVTPSADLLRDLGGEPDERASRAGDGHRRPVGGEDGSVRPERGGRGDGRGDRPACQCANRFWHGPCPVHRLAAGTGA